MSKANSLWTGPLLLSPSPPRRLSALGLDALSGKEARCKDTNERSRILLAILSKEILSLSRRPGPIYRLTLPDCMPMRLESFMMPLHRFYFRIYYSKLDKKEYYYNSVVFSPTCEDIQVYIREGNIGWLEVKP